MAMYQSSINGVGREFDRAAVAAAKIARPSGGDKVTLSAEARARTLDSEDTAPGGIEPAMVDLRVAKYSAIANMRVLSVADDVAHEAENLIRPRR